MAPKPAPLVELTHLHTNTVSLTEQVGLVADRLRREGALTFRALIAGCDRLTTVVRFLALLELFRVSQVALEQLSPLGELTVRWTAGDDRTAVVADDYGPQPELNEEER
jgi:segregation and condensation protein A